MKLYIDNPKNLDYNQISPRKESKIMAKAKYCPNCKRMVTPTKKFNWWIVIFLGGWLWYLPFYLLKGKKCPICQSKCMSLEKAKEKGIAPAVM